MRTLCIRRLVAGACASALLLGGCSFDPIREVQPVREPVTDPGLLAFDEPVVEAAAPTSSPALPTSTPLEVLPAATWVVDSAHQSLSVYSGPDNLYTRIGALAADDAVLATGRRLESRDTIWMEISWDDVTAWIDASALTQSNTNP